LGKGDATNPLKVGAFICGRRQVRRLGQDVQRASGVFRANRQLGAFAKQRQELRGTIGDEKGKRLAQPLREDAKFGKGWRRSVALDLADESLGRQSPGELLLSEAPGQARFAKTLANRVHQLPTSIAWLIQLTESILTAN